MTLSVRASTDQSTEEVAATAASSPQAADVTKSNGAVPPGSLTAVVESVALLDVTDDGIQHLVYRDTRQPGTRSPILEHPYGGTTCVLSVTGVSSGTDYAVMIDNFAVPPGEPVWWVVEPGQEELADRKFGGGGDTGHV